MSVVETPREVLGLRPAVFDEGLVRVTALRSRTVGTAEIEVAAQGFDPGGIVRELARGTARFEPGSGEAVVEFDLPPELRNRITRFEIAGQRSAGAVTLTDDALKRREVALIDAGSEREGLQLLSPTHYLRQALEPTADLIDGTLSDILLADPDAIIMADVAKIAESDQVLDWIEEGGLLVRFAGPRLAASDTGRDVDDPLLPVRLRAGGRSVGGAMSWGEPRELAPFAEDSPFEGLTVPGEVTVTSQVMAEPDPELAERTAAALADGTPLVTMRDIGEGRVVLFHVTANAEWSSLPLSGLFVQMLERLAVSTRAEAPDAAALEGTTWVADQVIDAFGELGDAGEMPGVPGERLAEGKASADLPPGLYAHEDRRMAVNAVAAYRVRSPPPGPDGGLLEGIGSAVETPLKGMLLTLALSCLMADVIAALWLAGRLTGPRTGVAVVLIGLMLAVPHGADAQQGTPLTDEERLVAAAGNVVLAYVETGDTRVDRVAAAGLLGLSEVLYARTSVEPIVPMGVDLETDELSVFTFLYWPVTADQPAPELPRG